MPKVTMERQSNACIASPIPTVPVMTTFPPYEHYHNSKSPKKIPHCRTHLATSMNRDCTPFIIAYKIVRTIPSNNF